MAAKKRWSSCWGRYLGRRIDIDIRIAWSVSLWRVKAQKPMMVPMSPTTTPTATPTGPATPVTVDAIVRMAARMRVDHRHSRQVRVFVTLPASGSRMPMSSVASSIRRPASAWQCGQVPTAPMRTSWPHALQKSLRSELVVMNYAK